MSSEQAQIINKIVTKAVLEKIDIKEEVKNGEKDLYVVMGVATSIIPDESNYGQYFRMIGNFEAKRFSDGKRFISSTCILPEPVGGMIGNQLMTAIRAEGKLGTETEVRGKKRTQYEVSSAQFAFVIGAKPSSKGDRGYEWVSRPIVQPSGVDSLADLRGKVHAALPAPAQPADPAKSSKK